MRNNNNVEAKNSKKLLINIFVVFSLILSLTIIFIEEVFFSKSAQKVALQNTPKKSIERENVLQSFLQDSEQTLLSIRYSPFFKEYLNNGSNKMLMESILLSYAQSQGHFMQFRYINKKGNEVIRIDRKLEGRDAKLVSKENLQNKADRYYFKNSITKEANKVWFSAIDLNIENGQVQVPYMPTVRAILPIENHGSFEGILIINYFAKRVISQITNAPLYDMILFNDKGETIYHYNDKFNWGNSLPHKFNIKNEYPNEYKKILSQALLQTDSFTTKKFTTKLSDGINILLKLNHNHVKEQKRIAQIEYLITASIVFGLSIILTLIIIALFAKRLLNIEQLNSLLFENKEKTKELFVINKNLENIVESKTKELTQKNKTLSKSIIYSHTDINGVITDVSDLFCELSGYSKDELIGNTHSIMRHPDMPSSIFHEMWKTISSGKIWYGDIKNRKKDDTYSWLHSEIKPKFSDMNEIIGYVSIRSDITAKKDLEEQHKVLAEKTKLASMGEMIGNIAHQWRQPLSSISISATGMLYKKELGMFNDSEFEKEMNNINDKAQYLSKTIDTFKNFIKEDKVQVVVDVKEELNKSLNLLQATLENNYIIVNTNFCEEELKTKMVEDELIQVFINIINNAKDVLVEKDIENRWINIEASRVDESAIITIEDNAGGIPEDILPKVFDPYFTTKHQSQGTGLGLHMSHQIITDSSGGNLYVTNTKNGAKFTIELLLNEG